jgi:hypothetical protein
VPAGPYNVAVTARTFYGETSAVPTQFTTSTGTFKFVVTSGIGVYIYRLYVSFAAHNTTLNGGISAGVSSLVAASGTGITAGAYYLLDTGVGTQEVVQVASSYVSGTTIPLVAPTTYAHLNGVQFIPCPLLVAEMPVSAFGGAPITMGVDTLTPSNNLFPDPLPFVDSSAPQIPWAITEAVRLLTLSPIFEQNNPANRGVYQEKSGDRMVSFRSTEGTSGRGVPTLVSQATDLLSSYAYRGFM